MIPVIIDILGHRFEIFTLVSKNHYNVDLVMGIKYFQTKRVIDLQDTFSSFCSRSVPFFPVMTVEISPKMQKLVIAEAPFIEELSGMAIVKIET